ncbi:unnamed protein product [Protopolystoma xenopodis]|uniref:Uncharacterized protein n=1 Tax=Protopolystoma xenopodis TaxID=117903 RepID=A0A3S5CJ81_9PLAT|nr:unnamed protein product [Protopolystoma xenopodis]
MHHQSDSACFASQHVCWTTRAGIARGQGNGDAIAKKAKKRRQSAAKRLLFADSQSKQPPSAGRAVSANAATAPTTINTKRVYPSVAVATTSVGVVFTAEKGGWVSGGREDEDGLRTPFVVDKSCDLELANLYA